MADQRPDPPTLTQRVLRCGDTGCDCLNDCGDDHRVEKGTIPLCSWGRHHYRALDLKRRMPALARDLVAALRAQPGPLAEPVERALVALEESLNA